jgi:hypothetical protein
MLFIKKYLSFLVLLWLTNVTAQNSSTEAENKYTPNYNSIFNSSNIENSRASLLSANIDLISSIKFCPTALLRQKILMFWELDLYGTDFPLNMGFGFAFGNNWSDRYYFGRFNHNTARSSSGDALTPSQLMDNSTFTSGWTVHGGYKFYFSGNAFDGVYIEPFYTFEKMNYTIDGIVDGFEVDPFIGGDFDFSYRVHNVGLTIGFGTATGGNIMCTHDFFIRAGAKFFTFDRYELDQVGFSPPEFKYRKTTTYNHRIIPSITIGYAIGIGW